MTRWISLMMMLVLIVGCTKRPSNESVDVVVTNTLLEAAVHDLAGDRLTVLSLASPGMCPGHFDLKPGQMYQLRQAKLIGLFNFQKSLARKLSIPGDNPPNVALIHTTSGLALPATYLEICTQLTQALSARLPELRHTLQGSLRAIQLRMDVLRQTVAHDQVVNVPVLCSVHQAAFVHWLGYDPIATFVGSDAETLADVEAALKAGKNAGVRLVVANEPEGTALARVLADQLNVPMVTLANFPEVGETFDRLIRRNVTSLAKARHP